MCRPHARIAPSTHASGDASRCCGAGRRRWGRQGRLPSGEAGVAALHGAIAPPGASRMLHVPSPRRAARWRPAPPRGCGERGAGPPRWAPSLPEPTAWCLDGLSGVLAASEKAALGVACTPEPVHPQHYTHVPAGGPSRTPNELPAFVNDSLAPRHHRDRAQSSGRSPLSAARPPNTRNSRASAAQLNSAPQWPTRPHSAQPQPARARPATAPAPPATAAAAARRRPDTSCRSAP